MAKKKREGSLTLQELVVEMAAEAVVSGRDADMKVEVERKSKDEVSLKIQGFDLEIIYILPPWEWANALKLQLQRDWP